MENHKNFLDEIAIELNIQQPSDWGKIAIKDIIERGGVTLLREHYKGSLYNCLRCVYRGMNCTNK